MSSKHRANCVCVWYIAYAISAIIRYFKMTPLMLVCACAHVCVCVCVYVFSALREGICVFEVYIRDWGQLLILGRS